MAYHRGNYLRKVEYVIAVYNSLKEEDIPDTRIVANLFPKHNIFMSYRQWMNMKNMKPSEYHSDQIALF